MKIIWRWVNFVITWREHRNVIKTLNKLSDQELRDIGLYRGDIDRLVWLKEDKDSRGRG